MSVVCHHPNMGFRKFNLPDLQLANITLSLYRGLIILGFAFLIGIVSAQDEGRIWLTPATINGMPVRLTYDTGAEDYVLFAHAAQRLGLSVQPPAADQRVSLGEVAAGTSQPCTLVFPGAEVKTIFRVVDTPKTWTNFADGVVGWNPTRSNILVFFGDSRTMKVIRQVPEESLKWTKLQISKESPMLRLSWNSTTGQRSSIDVDTGSPHGAHLAPAAWRLWKAAHTKQPLTFDAYQTPGVGGVVIAEEAWANRLDFGPFSLSDLPVMEADTGSVALGGEGYQATLGLAAVRRMELVIDGPAGVAYLQPSKAPSIPYAHNRLGAVFTPANLESGDDLVARVSLGSPADQSGVRDGDLLLKIGPLDATKWRTDPAVLPLSRFWSQSAGTELQLTLRRGDENLQVKVVLRDIVSANASLTTRPPSR